MMDKQEWTPKCGDDVWYWAIQQPYGEGPDPYVACGKVIDDSDPTCIVVRVNSPVIILGFIEEFLYPTREAAKAALIEKLTQALEEAKRL